MNNPTKYTLPPQGPMMPPPPLPRQQAKNKWQQRFLSGNNSRPLTLQQERTIPNWLIGKSVVFFFIAFIACTVVWGYPMEMKFAIVSSFSVLLFFYGGKSMTYSWAHYQSRLFLKNIFFTGLVVRLVWICFCYFYFNNENYGNTFGDEADTGWYMDYAKGITEWIRGENRVPFSKIMDNYGGGIDDVGYPIWLSVLYLIVGVDNDVFFPFLVKCIVGAYCGVCIYRVAKRHFGEGTARMAAIFVALNPNMIYWCGTMFKEADMVFLCCLSVDLVDRTFTSGTKLTFKSLLPGVLVGFALFFFRAPLAIVLFLAMFSHIVMASHRVMNFGKKIIAGVMVATVLFIGMGDRLRTQAESIVEAVQSDRQQTNMEWRSRREGGNTFAKYASATVFAPLIFTIPFPSFNLAENSQMLQRQLSGGNYIKNIFSFFVILVMILMLIGGEWRRHVFILAYTLGYLVTLVLSEFAHSSRFHMPIWPMLMLFAAYGIQITKNNPKYRRWFTIVLCFEVVVCVAWNWFKLKGRGLV